MASSDEVDSAAGPTPRGRVSVSLAGVQDHVLKRICETGQRRSLMAGFDGAHTSLLDSAATDIYGVSSPSLAAVCSQIVLRRRVRDRIHPPLFIWRGSRLRAIAVAGFTLLMALIVATGPQRSMLEISSRAIEPVRRALDDPQHPLNIEATASPLREITHLHAP